MPGFSKSLLTVVFGTIMSFSLAERENFIRHPEVCGNATISCVKPHVSERERETHLQLQAALFQAAQDSECCSCPAFPIDKFLRYQELVRNALDTTVPHKWFFIQGSLIGSLRYGSSIKRLKSGKLHVVDNDVDVVLVHHPDNRENVVKSFMSLLPGWTVETIDHDGLASVKTPNLVMPTRCASEAPPQQKFRVDLHFINEHDDGTLSVDKNKDKHVRHELRHWIDDEGNVPYDLIFPLQKAKFAGGVGYAPNRYMEVLENWNKIHFGSPNKYPEVVENEYEKPLWKPSGKAQSFLQDCPCELNPEDFNEIHASIQTLHDEGYASFHDSEDYKQDGMPKTKLDPSITNGNLDGMD